MRPIQIVCVVHTIPEAHAVHSSTYGRKDAIFGILYSNTVGRNFREFGGGVKIYGRNRFADATDIACQSTISDYRESQLTPILDMSNRSAVSGARLQHTRRVHEGYSRSRTTLQTGVNIRAQYYFAGLDEGVAQTVMDGSPKSSSTGKLAGPRLE